MEMAKTQLFINVTLKVALNLRRLTKCKVGQNTYIYDIDGPKFDKKPSNHSLKV